MKEEEGEEDEDERVAPKERELIDRQSEAVGL